MICGHEMSILFQYTRRVLTWELSKIKKQGQLHVCACTHSSLPLPLPLPLSLSAAPAPIWVQVTDATWYTPMCI